MAEGRRRRMMEKVFRHGIESLYPHEFLELYLYGTYKRIDTNPLAHALLDKFGSIEALCNAPEAEIEKVDGVGKSAARHIKLLPLIAKGYGLHTSVKNKNIYNYKSDIEKRCVALLRCCTNERAYLLCFDNSKRLIKEAELSDGDPNGVDISVRKIMDVIANTATASVMLCHNHPSGSLQPSNEDFKTTADIMDFLEEINIELIDHLVIVEDRFVSCIPMGRRKKSDEG